MCPVHHPGKNHKRSQERLRLTTFRTRVYLWNEGSGLDSNAGFCFVSDFSPAGLGLYLKNKVSAGSTVRLAFDSANSTTYRATVMWANRVSFKQRFLGHEALSYRLGARFIFGSEAERQRYLKYMEELKLRVLAIEPGMKF